MAAIPNSPSFSLLKHGHLSNFPHFPFCNSFLSLNPKQNHSMPSHFLHGHTFLSKAKPHYEYQTPANLQEVHSIEEFDAALIQAKDNLVLVEYIASRRRQTPPLTVKLSQRQNDSVSFILVKADESEKTREICQRENVEKLPHCNFHKNKKKVHEKPVLKLEEFIRYTQYYGSFHRSVIQLHSMEHVENLIEDRTAEKKLIVMKVGMRNCEPCVKVYPTMVKMSAQMDDGVVFARFLGDDSGSCVEFLRSLGVVRVPTFLFIRDGEICRRYVGSVKPILARKVYEYYWECRRQDDAQCKLKCV